jgi:hypothetical protein
MLRTNRMTEAQVILRRYCIVRCDVIHAGVTVAKAFPEDEARRVRAHLVAVGRAWHAKTVDLLSRELAARVGTRMLRYRR